MITDRYIDVNRQENDDTARTYSVVTIKI